MHRCRANQVWVYVLYHPNHILSPYIRLIFYQIPPQTHNPERQVKRLGSSEALSLSPHHIANTCMQVVDSELCTPQGHSEQTKDMVGAHLLSYYDLQGNKLRKLSGSRPSITFQTISVQGCPGPGQSLYPWGNADVKSCGKRCQMLQLQVPPRCMVC